MLGCAAASFCCIKEQKEGQKQLLAYFGNQDRCIINSHTYFVHVHWHIHDIKKKTSFCNLGGRNISSATHEKVSS